MEWGSGGERGRRCVWYRQVDNLNQTNEQAIQMNEHQILDRTIIIHGFDVVPEIMNNIKWKKVQKLDRASGKIK